MRVAVVSEIFSIWKGKSSEQRLLPLKRMEKVSSPFKPESSSVAVTFPTEALAGSFSG